MTFQNPQILILLLLLLPALYYLRAGSDRTARILKHFSTALPASTLERLAIPVLALLLLTTLLIVAAGPQRYLPRPETARSGNFVFLVDVSRSMAARASCDETMQLDRARALMTDIVSAMPEAEFGITAFTELAFPFTEPSLDHAYLQEVINYGLFVEAVPTPGSDLGNALLVLAEKKSEQPPVYARFEYVILLSDGDYSDEANQQLGKAIPVLNEAGIKVVSIGTGSGDGLPIPTLGKNRECLEGRFERAEGKEFYTRLFAAPLQLIAEQTGGRYFVETQKTELLDYLRSLLHENADLQLPLQTEDISPWFLLLATLCLFGLVWLRRF